MSFSQDDHRPHDEINLIEMFVKLWEGKTIIALGTFLCGCLGLGFILLLPKHVGEFAIRGPVGTSLAAYAPLNDGIKKHYGDFLQTTGNNASGTNQFEISTEGIVEDMVRELQDFSEFENALREYVPKIRSMSADEYSNERNDLLENLTISYATESNPTARVTFEWHDEAQLLDIFTTTLSKAEENLNANKTELLTGLAKNIARRTLSEIRSLDQDLLSVMESTNLESESRLILLKEQAAIARELNLADNTLTEGGQRDQISFSILNGKDDHDRPRPLPEALYLKGYKSLEKEVALIEARTSEQSLLMNPLFLETKRRIIALKNNASAELFQEAIDASPFPNRSNIFNINRDAIRVKNKRSLPLILAASLLLGFLVSCTLVLIKDALHRHKRATVS